MRLKAVGAVNIFARSVFFVSSYAPLGLLFFIQYVMQHNKIAIAALVIASLGCIALWALLHWWLTDVQATCDEVLESRRPGSEVVGYISSYILPLLSFSVVDWRHIALVAAYLLVIWYLYVTTDMIRVNPTLTILLRRGVYQVKLREYGEIWLVAPVSKRPTQGERVQVVRLDGGFLLLR